MKLDSEYFKSKRVIGAILGPFIFAIVLLVIGYKMYQTQSKIKDYVKTEAEIVSVRGERPEDVIIQFYVGEQKYTTHAPSYDDSMDDGDKITVYYNPENPSEVGDKSIICYIALALGAILVVVGIANIFVQIKKSKDLKKQEEGFKEYQNKIEMYGEDLENPKYDEDKVYHFVTNPQVRTINLKDDAGEIIYNVCCDKYKLFGGSEYRFEDVVNNTSKVYKMGSTTRTDNGGSFGTQECYFKINGIKCWDYLHKLGFRIKTSAFDGGLNFTYTVERFGMPYATFVTENPGAHGPEDIKGFNMGKLANVTLPGYYKITTREQNLELIMLLGYTFSNSTQFVID